MGIFSALQTTVRGVKQIPRIIHDASYEQDEAPVFGEMPNLPYTGQITPDGPTYDMDFGGGKEITPTPGATKERPSNRKNGLGKLLEMAPVMLQGGIAGAATRNVAGGGGTDFFRAMNAGNATAEASADKKRQIARQAENDGFNRRKQESEINENEAQAAERQKKANAPPPAEAIGKFGYYDRQGAWHPAPAEAADTSTADKRNYDISRQGGYEVPESKTFEVPTGVPGLGPLKSTVSNVPAPEGYNNMPGTRGDHRIVMPSAELKGDLRHPDKEPPWSRIVDKDGNVKFARVNSDGEPEEVPVEAKGKPQRTAAPKKTVQQTTTERTAAADQQGLEGDERKQYIANGRLATGKGKGDLKASIAAIAAGMGGSAPSSVPAANLNRPATQTLPPEIVAQLPFGVNKKLKAPDGTLQMWVKNPDGTVKRLR